MVERAVAAGATLSTHLGNGLPRLLPKFDNPLMAQLGHDGLAAGFIADGLHVPVPALHAMIRAKGAGAILARHGHPGSFFVDHTGAELAW